MDLSGMGPSNSGGFLHSARRKWGGGGSSSDEKTEEKETRTNIIQEIKNTSSKSPHMWNLILLITSRGRCLFEMSLCAGSRLWVSGGDNRQPLHFSSFALLVS